VIPRKVTGKFSVRIVPNQTPELVEKIVIDYLERYTVEKWICLSLGKVRLGYVRLEYVRLG
jgi:hypothetical protein